MRIYWVQKGLEKAIEFGIDHVDYGSKVLAAIGEVKLFDIYHHSLAFVVGLKPMVVAFVEVGEVIETYGAFIATSAFLYLFDKGRDFTM